MSAYFPEILLPDDGSRDTSLISMELSKCSLTTLLLEGSLGFNKSPGNHSPYCQEREMGLMLAQLGTEKAGMSGDNQLACFRSSQ
jgi:hypothetical protein